ncbi:MAG: sialate O-acetylesterase [Cyanobacteria bacterium J06626_6]
MVDTNNINNRPIELEAESLRLRGFYISDIDPSASNGQIIRGNTDRAVAQLDFAGAAGTYGLTLDAYDENDGNAVWEVKVNGVVVGSATLNQNLGSDLPNQQTKTQITFNGLNLKPGDKVKLIGRRNGYEMPSLDRVTLTLQPPAVDVEIISNGGDRSGVVTVNEGTLSVTDFEVNIGDDPVTYSIEGGEDQAAFDIDTRTGVLSFKVAPDYELPADTNRNNVYNLNVVATGDNTLDSQFLSVVVRDINDEVPLPPFEIVSNDTGAPDNRFTTVRVKENQLSVADVNVSGSQDGVFYRLNSGADRNLFSIDAATGELSFNQPADFENPLDDGSNNTYQINILAQRGNQFDSQFMTVVVEDVVEEDVVDGGGTTSEPVPVYLMAGQSNMVGVPQVADLSDDSYVQPFSAAPIWSRSQDEFVDLAPGFDGRPTRMGPELSFGRQIVGRHDEDVYLVKYGFGNTSLAQNWNPDGSGAQYNLFTSTVDEALGELTAQGIDYEIEGLVWMQGESDTYNNSYAAAYEENLLGFVDSVRDLYGADLDVAIGLIRNDLPTSAMNRELVRDAQRAVSAADSNVFLVDTDALGGSDVMIPGDLTHYSADGQVLLGNAFANALIL